MTGEGGPVEPAHRAGRLDFVEVGRGLAALAVVVFHANASARFYGGPVWHWPRLLEHGVDFFFVLSGFVILHAHHRDIGHPDRVRRYALKRAIRLFPTLWIVVLSWFALRLLVGHMPRVETLVASLLPYPSLQPTLPLVVWTLRHEIVFYLLFAIAVASRRIGAALFAGWACLVVAQIAAAIVQRPISGLPAFFVSGFSLDFLLGMAVYAINRARPAAPSPVPLAIGAALLIGIALILEGWEVGRSSLQDYVSPGATWGAALLGIGFAAVLYGLVRLEGVVRAPRLLLALGACSYALYLVHTPVNSIAQIAVRMVPGWARAMGAGHVLLIVTGVAAGWTLYRFFERPVMLMLRRRFGMTPPVELEGGEPKPQSCDHQSTAASGIR